MPTSAWTVHLTAYRASHPHLSMKECMQQASKTYRKSTRTATQAPRQRYRANQLGLTLSKITVNKITYTAKNIKKRYQRRVHPPTVRNDNVVDHNTIYKEITVVIDQDKNALFTFVTEDDKVTEMFVFDSNL